MYTYISLNMSIYYQYKYIYTHTLVKNNLCYYRYFRILGILSYIILYYPILLPICIVNVLLYINIIYTN